jgi:hypothetical protein
MRVLQSTELVDGLIGEAEGRRGVEHEVPQ